MRNVEGTRGPACSCRLANARYLTHAGKAVYDEALAPMMDVTIVVVPERWQTWSDSRMSEPLLEEGYTEEELATSFLPPDSLGRGVMTMRTEKATLARVTSPRDGTEIAYFTTGAGPPLVLVHGLLGDHTRWEVLRPHLEPHFTLHALDRRGRGASGDGAEYAVEREFEDVAAVVDAVADASGTKVDVLGSSGGAAYAVAAAAATTSIRRLVLFEPPAAPALELLPAELRERLAALLAEGDREGVLVTAYRAVVGLSDEEIPART